MLKVAINLLPLITNSLIEICCRYRPYSLQNADLFHCAMVNAIALQQLIQSTNMSIIIQQLHVYVRY